MPIGVVSARARVELAAGARSTAVTEKLGYERISDCSMCDPSVDAKYFCSLHELHERVDEARARHLQRLVVDLQQQIELRLQRHVERVLLDRRVPARLRKRFDRRQPHRLGVDLPVRPGDRRRLRRDARDLVLRDDAAARESPGAVDDHAHAEAVVLGVDDVLDPAVAGEDELVAVAVDADVGVAGARLSSPTPAPASARSAVRRRADTRTAASTGRTPAAAPSASIDWTKPRRSIMESSWIRHVELQVLPWSVRRGGARLRRACAQAEQGYIRFRPSLRFSQGTRRIRSRRLNRRDRARHHCNRHQDQAGRGDGDGTARLHAEEKAGDESRRPDARRDADEHAESGQRQRAQEHQADARASVWRRGRGGCRSRVRRRAAACAVMP